jgi:glycerol kinase
MPSIAAIDLGTSSIRVGVFDEDGTRLGLASQRLTTRRPAPGFVEQDAIEIRDLAATLLTEAVQNAGRSLDDLAALGITNQRGSVVAWDSSTGLPLGPVIGWQDTRTSARVEELRSLGLPATTSASCTKLEWLTTHDPGCQAAQDSGLLRFGTLDSWLTYSLSGNAAWITDPTNASATGLYDAGARGWFDAALELFNLDPTTLPTIVASSEVVARTSLDLVGAEIPLAARIGDQQASCFAYGLVPGDAKLTLGTSAMIDLAVADVTVPAPEGAYALPLYMQGGVERFCHEGSINTAGSVVEWLVSVGLLPNVEAVDEVAGVGWPGFDFLPSQAGLGAPHHEGSVRALMAGISMDTTGPDIVRGALQGLALRVGEVAALLAVEGSLHVDGGLSQSSVLLQLIADATGCVIKPAEDPETAARGAAMLAASAPGIDFPDMPSAKTHAGIHPTTTSSQREANAQQLVRLIQAAHTI